MTELDLIFTAYLMKNGISKKKLGDHLCVSPKTMVKMWRIGIGQWRWDEVVKAAQFLGIPIETLRETLTYRKDKQ